MTTDTLRKWYNRIASSANANGGDPKAACYRISREIRQEARDANVPARVQEAIDDLLLDALRRVETDGFRRWAGRQMMSDTHDVRVPTTGEATTTEEPDADTEGQRDGGHSRSDTHDGPATPAGTSWRKTEGAQAIAAVWRTGIKIVNTGRPELLGKTTADDWYTIHGQTKRVAETLKDKATTAWHIAQFLDSHGGTLMEAFADMDMQLQKRVADYADVDVDALREATETEAVA